MFIPSDYIAQEQHRERLREIERIRLIRLVTPTPAEQLQQFGKLIFGSKKPRQPSKN